MDKEQILSLMEKATKGPWEIKEDSADGKDEVYCHWHRVGPWELTGKKMDDDDRFLAALPDIAQTALEAMKKIEELEDKIDYFCTSFRERNILWENAMSELQQMKKADSFYWKSDNL